MMLIHNCYMCHTSSRHPCHPHPLRVLFQVCVPVPQHGDKDPVYVSPGARAAGGEGAPLSGTALPAAPHLPAQNHHSHNAAARGPHPGLWLPAALSHGHPQVRTGQTVVLLWGCYPGWRGHTNAHALPKDVPMVEVRGSVVEMKSVMLD